MFYKAMKENEVVDVFENLQYVKYFPRSRAVLDCNENEFPQGILSRDVSTVWHVNGWPDLPGYQNVDLYEIDDTEYNILLGILEEGKQPEPETEPEPEPEPIIDDDTLAWAKKQKIVASKVKLQEFLQANPLVSYAHGDKEGIYAVTEEKQSMMLLNYSTYQMKKAAGIPTELTWNETGEECEVWREEEYVQLSIEIENYVKPLVSAQQSIEKQIRAATSLEEVDAVEIIF